MKSIQGIIFDIKKYALHDGPGIRTTVFLKGCPLRCWWCHNPEGLNSDIEVIRKVSTTSTLNSSNSEVIGRIVSVNDVMDEIKKDWIFYEQSNGGVTFSGGEPLMQPEFLSLLLKKCHQMLDCSTTLDTSGYTPWKIIDSIKNDVDLFLYDIKFIDPDQHKKYTGLNNKQILDNLINLDKQNNNVVIRFPVIPGITDTSTNINQLCEWLKDLSVINEIHLLPYHKIAKAKYEKMDQEYKLKTLEPPSNDHLKNLAARFKNIGFAVKIGG